LRERPPSAFSIPDNAPPSPPSDHPAEPLPIPSPSTQRKEAASKSPAKAKVSGRSSAKAKAKTADTDDYTVEQLAATFSSDDWEELYAFVDIIQGLAGQERYDRAWKQWAESQDNQTVEQWRQYYEKVVRPQWLRDPEWKREQIRKKVEMRHEGSKESASQSNNQDQGLAEEDDNATGPQPMTAHKSKNEEAEKQLRSEDEHLDNLPSKQPGEEGVDKASHVIVQHTNKKRSGEEAAKFSTERKLGSSSTARYESPKYITELYQNVLKRNREDDDAVDRHNDNEEPSHPVKRQKTASPAPAPAPADPTQAEDLIGTQIDPVPILSSEGASTTTPSEVAEEPLPDQTIEQILGDYNDIHEQHDAGVEKDIESILSADDFIDIDHLPLPDGIEESSDDDLPSDSPTPRAARQKANNFDTQAILSSPSPSIGNTRLPLPLDDAQDTQGRDERRSPSLAPLPDSDASTTESILEYRRSMDEYDLKPSYPNLDRLPRPASPSPAPSSSSSTGSGDPDPPLDAQELNEFFDVKEAEGFDSSFITAALKRTRMRPALAEQVLEAWRQGDPLPVKRGIWSREDDEDVESGDGVALAKLERKHTMDGWGGITERLGFLGTYRYR
jgi:hypothetical protein